MPNNIGLTYDLSAGADSIRTFDQSASSSSASSMGREVVTPWPISERSTTTSTVSSAPMRSQAFGANGAAAAAPPALRPAAGRWKPMTRLATPAASRNSRRVISGAALMSRSLGGAMDGGADPLVCAAATDVGHGRVDVGVRRMWVFREQRRGSHGLPRLAVTALRHIFFDPRALHGVRPVLGQAFDRGHPFAGDGRHGQHAGARRDAVQVDSAGAALGDAAAELRAGEAEGVPQHPEERGVGGDVDRFAFAVDGEADRGHERRPRGRWKQRVRADARMEGGSGRGSLFIYRAPDPSSPKAKSLSGRLLTTSVMAAISSPAARQLLSDSPGGGP